jgi:ubiquitin C-terminal hydrolase
MNNFFQLVDSKIKKIYKFLTKDSKVFFLFKLTIAFSTLTLIVFVLLMRKNKQLARLYCQNIGYLRIIKPDPLKYKQLVKSKAFNKDVFHKVVKKFYSYPNGITNFGNNCYINVLMQVNLFYLVFS